MSDNGFNIHQPPKDHASIDLFAIHQDKRMSNALRGLLVTLLTIPDDWKIRKQYLVNLGTDSEETIKNQLKQLRELGYLKMVRRPAGGGRFEWDFFPYEKPQDPETTRQIISGLPLAVEEKAMGQKSPNGKKAPAPGAPPAAMAENHPMAETRSEPQNDHRVKNHGWPEAQCINPDLTLSITVNSLSLSSSEDQDLNSSPEIAGVILPEAPQEVKPVEREEESFLNEDQEREENARERARRQSLDPDWSGIPEHVEVVRTPGLSELAPEVISAFNSRSPRKDPPAPETPPHVETLDLPPDQVAAREAKKQQEIEKFKAYMAKEKAQKELSQGIVSTIAEDLNQPEPQADLQPAAGPAPGAPPEPVEAVKPESPTPRRDIFTPPAWAPKPQKLTIDEITARLQKKQQERTPEQIARIAERERQAQEAEARLAKVGNFSMTPSDTLARKEQESKQKVSSEKQVWIEQQQGVEIERLLAMGDAALEEVYRINLEPLNPNPAKDLGNLRKLKAWYRQASSDARAATIKAVWQAKAEGMYAIRAVRERLADLGFMSMGEGGWANV